MSTYEEILIEAQEYTKNVPARRWNKMFSNHKRSGVESTADAFFNWKEVPTYRHALALAGLKGCVCKTGKNRDLWNKYFNNTAIV